LQQSEDDEKPSCGGSIPIFLCPVEPLVPETKFSVLMRKGRLNKWSKGFDMLAFMFPSQSPAQVIRTSAGKRKDQQYYQGPDKKLTMRYPRLSVQRVYSCAVKRFPQLS
jgi:hypothetical protein